MNTIAAERIHDDPQMSDEDLVYRALAGDREAFGALWDRHHRVIYAFSLQRTGHREMAQDATAETFRRALAKLASYRGDGFRSWLFVIARNVIVDAARKRPMVSLDAIPERYSTADDMHDRAVAIADLAQVERALPLLSPAEREVIELRIAGLGPEEIAQALGKSRHAIDIAYHRGLVRLRSLLTSNGGHYEA